MDALRRRLAAAGLDLAHPFRAGWAEGLPGASLPDVRGEGGLAVLVGNTRALWEPFVSALRADPALLAPPPGGPPDRAAPLDTYVARAIRDSIGSVMPARLTEALERAIDEGLVRRQDANLLRAEIGAAA